MIIIQNGNFTIIENTMFMIFKIRSEVSDLANNYLICSDQKFDSSEKHPFEDYYCLTIPRNKITNSFFAQSFGLYNGISVKLYKTKCSNECVWATSISQNSEQFGFIKIGSYFGKEISLSEFKIIWFERKPSDLGFPYPIGLPKYEEFYL